MLSWSGSWLGAEVPPHSCVEVASWLDPDRQERADGRLRRMKVEYR